MDECHISTLRDPDSENDAATKKYVDSLIGPSVPNISSTPNMISNNTTVTGLTCVAHASSVGGDQTRAWRAFTNEIVTPGSPASTSGWVSSVKDAAPWIQMQYLSSIVITSFNIFVTNSPFINITSWSVQGGNIVGGSDFTTLLTSNTLLNANTHFSFNIDNRTAYKVYRFNIVSRTGNSANRYKFAAN
jgi:hypothetical protein